MVKSYRVRLLPTAEQEQMLWEHVHAMRFVWNWGLALNMERFRNGESRLSKPSMGKILTELRRSDEAFKWLNDVSVDMVGVALLDLDNAYTRFFRIQKKEPKYTAEKVRWAKRKDRKLRPYDMNGHPKFKSKNEADPKFHARSDRLYFTQSGVNIEKIGKIKYKTNLDLPVVSKKRENTSTFINPRVRYTNGKWILSFGIECQTDTKPELNDFAVGIDLGIHKLAVASYNGQFKRFKNINKKKRVRRLKKRLCQAQRSVSRKFETNGNYNKTQGVLEAQQKVKNLSRKLANTRLNYTHHVTRKIVNLNPRAIAIEDLNVKGMMKNRSRARAIQEQAWHEFRRQIEYKSEWAGIEVVVADRFFPSSKKCSGCGSIKKDLKPNYRVYKCEVCGLKIDRDDNAALNLERLAN